MLLHDEQLIGLDCANLICFCWCLCQLGLVRLLVIAVLRSYDSSRSIFMQRRKHVVDNDILIDIWMDSEIRRNENNLNKTMQSDCLETVWFDICQRKAQVEVLIKYKLGFYFLLPQMVLNSSLFYWPNSKRALTTLSHLSDSVFLFYFYVDGHWIFWASSYRKLWAAICALGLKPGSLQ